VPIKPSILARRPSSLHEWKELSSTLFKLFWSFLCMPKEESLPKPPLALFTDKEVFFYDFCFKLRVNLLTS